MLHIIYDLAKKKSWLREECGWIIYAATQQLASHGSDPSYAQLVIDQLCSSGLAKTPEGIPIWLSVQSNFATVKFPKGVWQGEDPLHVKDVRTLAKVLKEASEPNATHVAGEASRQRGTWNAKLHFAWDAVLADVLREGSSTVSIGTKTPKHLNFADFWIEIVDSTCSGPRVFESL